MVQPSRWVDDQLVALGLQSPSRDECFKACVRGADRKVVFLDARLVSLRGRKLRGVWHSVARKGGWNRAKARLSDFTLAQLVEHRPSKATVAGSIPVSCQKRKSNAATEVKMCNSELPRENSDSERPASWTLLVVKASQGSQSRTARKVGGDISCRNIRSDAAHPSGL